MIAMLISDAEHAERKLIYAKAKDAAAMYSDEKWLWLQCSSEAETKSAVQDQHIDLACLDLTMYQSLQMLPELRKSCPNAHWILIADTTISPLEYMKPSIHAESLLLKPLQNQLVQSTVDEAVSLYVKKFEKPDQKKVFVAENKGCRNIIEYQNICYFEAREKKVFVNTGRQEYCFSDTIDRLQDELSDSFLRVHRSFLVNIDKIQQVYISRSTIVLEGDIEVPLSRSYKASVKAFLEKKGERNESGKNLDAVI